MHFRKVAFLYLTFVFYVSLSTNVLAQEIVIESAMEIAFSGMPPLMKKELNMARGEEILVKDVHIWSYDDDDWMNGGQLHLINDDSMGTFSRITCSISPDAGDEFMQDPKRRSVSMRGTLQGYSDRSGITISPCEIGEPIE